MRERESACADAIRQRLVRNDFDCLVRRRSWRPHELTAAAAVSIERLLSYALAEKIWVKAMNFKPVSSRPIRRGHQSNGNGGPEICTSGVCDRCPVNAASSPADQKR